MVDDHSGKTRDGQPTIYGYGWFVGGPISVYHGLREVRHGGDAQGICKRPLGDSGEEFAVVVLSHGENEKASTKYIGPALKIYDVVSAH